MIFVIEIFESSFMNVENVPFYVKFEIAFIGIIYKKTCTLLDLNSRFAVLKMYGRNKKIWGRDKKIWGR